MIHLAAKKGVTAGQMASFMGINRQKIDEVLRYDKYDDYLQRFYAIPLPTNGSPESLFIQNIQRELSAIKDSLKEIRLSIGQHRDWHLQHDPRYRMNTPIPPTGKDADR